MEHKLISVSVNIVVGGHAHRVRVVALGIGRAVEIAGNLDDNGNARLELPIDSERFFVEGSRSPEGIVLTEVLDPALGAPAISGNTA